MSRRVVLLRAVNVGGATLPMARLRAIATDLGATDVSTYIASGNLVADVPGDPAAFDRALEQAIETELGFFREAISRSHEELAAALAAHPFEVLDPKRSYVTFLLTPPTDEAVAAARTHETHDDRWEVVDGEMHLRYADGAGSAQMKVPTIMRALGTPGTARNLTTVARLIDLSR